ncbi:hypothetical protein [Piscirickettsia litoralis]|uniref:Transglutaminase-like domain-containing protein n=1 Tax=Piscirickettsia litoralis TaxID=1891921 RepID=A0ABX2ZY03_9GAMM|nr:hypothetical protein [Piscirickettsia litoralis]ODN41487.1 hypothetical protein BGC07_15345 [Piscirickettsia litoralis]
MNPDELLAIGAALVWAVRRSIKYSENIKSLYSGDLYNSSFRRDRKTEINKLRTDYAQSDEYAVKALRTRVGLCAELSTVAVYLGKIIAVQIKHEQKVYISKVGTPKHSFCLIHQSKALFKSIAKRVEAQSLQDLICLRGDLKNAVIVDPWIYKASKLSNYKGHLEHAKLYGVEDFYKGKVTNKVYSKEMHTKPPKIKITESVHKALECFRLAYKDEKNKLIKNKYIFAKGRKLASVRKDLDSDIKRRKQLKSLRRFIQQMGLNLK